MDLFGRVDEWLYERFIPRDAVLEGALQRSKEAGLPTIQVAPNQGKLLQILARSMNAKRVLEIGTLGGYSTIWLARVCPVVTIEIDPRHAAVARENVGDLSVEVRVGRALDVLPTLSGPFDFFFIDADKENNAEYVRWAMTLARPGSMIVVDNVVRGGRIIDADDHESKVEGTRALHEMVSKEPRLVATVVQTVGSKGHDGLLVAHFAG